MLRIALGRTFRSILNQTQRQSISNWKLPSFEIDPAGISGFFESRTETYLTLAQKLSQIKPMSLYYGLDQWSRQLLVTLSVDLNCGFATSIIIATLIIKTIFLFPTLKGQMMGLRQGQLKGLTDSYRQKMKTAQMTRNKFLMDQANFEYKMTLKKKGVNHLTPLLNLFQIPILLTWFFSLRYMSNLPEIYPQMLTEGYFWFADLSTYDPYFVLPILAACLTSYSIARSPNLARNNVSLPFLIPYIKYIKFLPFASLSFTAFFPASINLYWMVLAGYQLMTTELMYTKFVQKAFSNNRSGPKSRGQFFEAVFIDQKKTSEEIMKSASDKKIEAGNKVPNEQYQTPSYVKKVNVLLKKPKKKKEETQQ